MVGRIVRGGLVAALTVGTLVAAPALPASAATVRTDPVDPAVCPILASMAPGVYIFRIDPDGDVWLLVGGEWVKIWACPPEESPGG